MKKNVSRKATIPVFEKPVIIRSKSTSDLHALCKKELRRGDKSPFTTEAQELRVEQDLSVIIPQKELQNEEDFEVWADHMEEDLEAATLEKYMFASSACASDW